MVYRMILSKWALEKPDYDKYAAPRVLEGDFSLEQVLEYNQLGYNAYYLPNHPKQYNRDVIVDGTMIDVWNCVFVDLDMKDYNSTNKDRCHSFATKEQFVEFLFAFELTPSRIVDSGGGIHAYWNINDLDDMSYLRIQRRLARQFTTDPAVGQIFQLMRVPGTINWKKEDDLKLATIIFEEDRVYSCEDLDRALPKITPKDEEYCETHYNKTHGLHVQVEVSDELPAKWFKLAVPGTEAHRLFYGAVKDRSAADYRLAHLLHSNSFTREEAMAVLCQTNKATDRVGVHRYNYADNIVNKVWVYVEEEGEETVAKVGRVRSARDLLMANPDEEYQKGQRLPCWDYFDGTDHGTRHGQVLGLIGGSGVGKTAFGLNMFMGFVVNNPGIINVIVTLEQPELEYLQRWKKMCQGNQSLVDSVYILGNYNDDGTYRHLSLPEIEDEIKELERVTGKKIGAVMVDHIGVLKKENRNGENQGLIDICQYMKAFAVNTKTFLIMQSQAPREKASIGDIELDKDAAYGTVFFESFCDWVVTLWQPLKRVYDRHPNMTVTVFKFCKIRHKQVLKDKLQEDQRYPLMLDPETDLFRKLTADEMKSFDFVAKQATTLRSKDKKSEPGRVSAIDWTRAAFGGNPEIITQAEKERRYGKRDTDASGRPGSATTRSGIPSKS